jgi:hypothetical protein
VRRGFLHVDLGASAPDQDEAGAAVLLLERADVVDQLERQILLGRARLDVRSGQPLDVLLIEDRRHRLDGLEFVAQRAEERRFEHARSSGCGVAVLFEDVPPAEDDVIEGRQLDQFANARRTAFGALPQPDRA